MSWPSCDDRATGLVCARAGRRLAPLLATLAVFALVACERATTPDPSAAPPPLSTSTAELAGAPAVPAPPPPAEPRSTPDYVPPEAPTAAAPAPSAVVAMEPIPNPPEPEPTRRGFRVLRPTLHYARNAHPRRRVRFVSAAATRTTPRAARRIARGAEVGSAAPASHAMIAPRPPPVAADAAKTSQVDERGSRLAALQGALARTVQSDARLAVPHDLTPDRPSDITLTLPAEFADSVRREAGRQGLSEAAASVSLSARLAGDGYTAMPDDAQVQPLQSDRPTRFHWTVISQAGARGPLQASLSAQLLGGGADSLDLGVVKPQVQRVEGWRALGVGMLALALLALVAWLGRARRPRPRPDLRPSSRPLDMNSGRRL